MGLLQRLRRRSWHLAPGLVQLRSEVNAAYPTRATISDGSIGDASHSSRTSDHNPDPAGWVRAIDVTEWDPGTPNIDSDDVAEALAEFLRALKDPRVRYVIWRGRMFSSYATATRRAWEWGKYTGPNGHFKHVHVSLVGDSRALSSRAWGFKRPGRPAPPVRPQRPWRTIKPGDTDKRIAAAGGRDNSIAETQLRLKALASKWHNKKLDPGAINGTHGAPSQRAVSEFKRIIIYFQTLNGTRRWPDTGPAVGGATIEMLRGWTD